MATISLSPTPAPITAMSSRRVPLTSNPNVANSPLRGQAALASLAKQKRSYANVQREEAYGQPPPTKKQAIENTTARARSPSKLPRSQLLAQRGVSANPVVKATTRERAAKLPAPTRAAQDDHHDKEVWKKHYRAKFPKMVFYFESIPDDVRAKLTKRVTYLGARQEPFFSNAVTHVITTRSIPTGQLESHDNDDPEQSEREPVEQPQTINPSLLDRNTAAKRKLLYEFRNVPTRSQQVSDTSKQAKGTRNNDVLYKARQMGKKIWSLDKFQNMISVLLEAEVQQSATMSRAMGARAQTGLPRAANEQNLLQMLHHERINGPSDRDPTASIRELTYFKGPYIYVWDMDEKQKPIMVREYPKVANKADGEWPQFRSVGNGRCPFVEEVEVIDKDHRKPREQEKARATAKREDPVPVLKPPEIPPPKPVTGKRTLTEMEDGQSRVRSVTPSEFLNPAKAALSKQGEARPQNAFTSRAEGGRLFHGEPVASGLQASNVTSAIRSQMISSTAGISGVKAGTSKEVHGLQRKVLQIAGTTSQEASSRRLAEVNMDSASSRSATVSRHNSRTAPQEEDGSRADAREKKSHSQPLKSKKDLKPGYCENCQDKFRDFDEHILSRKHRKFAENDDNWEDLDALLGELKRHTKGYSSDDEDLFGL